MVKKDDIIKDFQDVVQGVTNNRDECIVLYFDKSTTELRHFGTSCGQQFLGKHEEFIHRFMAFCSGTKEFEACLNVTDAASIGPSTGNKQNVSKKEVNPENDHGPSVIDKGQSPGQNTVNTSQSGTNLILAGHYRRTGDIQTVMSGKQTGFSPERKQPDPIVIKDDPDSVQKDPDSVLNDPDPVQNDPYSVQIDPYPAQNDPVSVQYDSGPVQQPDPIEIKDDPDSVQKDPDSVLNEPDSVQNDPDPVLNEPDSVLIDPDSVQNDPDSVLNEPDSVLNDPDPVQNDPYTVQNYPDPVKNKTVVIKSDPDPVKCEILPVKSDQDSRESNLLLAPKKVEQDDVQNESNSVHNNVGSIENNRESVQNESNPVNISVGFIENNSDSVQNESNPVNISEGFIENNSDSVQNESNPIQSDPDPEESEILPIKSDQDSVKSNLPVAPKNVDQYDVQNESNPVHSNVGSIENNRESVQDEPNPIQRDPDPVESEILPIKSDQDSVENNLPVAPKKVEQDDVKSKPNPVHSNIGSIENNRESVQNESSTIQNDPDLVQNKLDPTLNVQNSLPSEQNSEQRKTFIVLRHKSKPYPTVIPVLNSYNALLLNPMQNSGAAPKLTPNSAVLPTLTPNSASVQNRTPNSVTVPSLTPNLATVQKLIPYSAVIPNLTPYSAVLPTLTPNSATVPNLTPNSVTVPSLTRKPVVVPNLSTNLMTVLKRPPNSTVVPNLKSESATVPNLIPNLANVPKLTSNLATVPNLKSNLASGHGIKGKPLDQKQGHIEKFQEHTSKSGKRKRLLYTEEVKFLPSMLDIDLECTKMKVDSEDDMVQCEEHLDHSQEHMEHLDQSQEHMEHLDQGQEHMGDLDQGQEHMEHKKQGQEHMEYKEKGQEHMEHGEHKYGEHNFFDWYVDHPYAKKFKTQMVEQTEISRDMSLLMEVNEIDKTTDQYDGKKEKDHTLEIATGAGKTSSPVKNSEEDKKPRKLTAVKKGHVKEERFSLMMVSYKANYDMPDGATLTCLQCNQNFEDLKDLQFHLLKTKHIQVSTTETAFKCFTCLKYFQREWDLQQHMINTLHNGNVKKVPKTSINNTGNTVEKITWTDGSKTYRCLKCNNKFRNFLKAKSHVMKDGCFVQYCIRCQVCDELFLDKNSHQVHLGTIHKEDFPFRCKNCDKIFYRKKFYARHKEYCIEGTEEIGRRRKAAETCDSENLDAEQICIICRETFIDYDQLKAHIVQSGHEQISTTETINKCFTCNTCFQKYVDLTYHMSLTSHTGNPRVNYKRWVMKSSRSISCSFCREIFPSVEKCEEHVKEKTCMERWSRHCLFCTKTFFQKNIYEVHIKSEHYYQRPLKCFKCGQEYTQLSAFLEHQEECNHGNDKLPTLKKEGEIKQKNYCTICDRTFSSSIVLKLHKWRAHKEAMFKCEICKCKFKRFGQLRHHLKMNKHSSSVSEKKTAANKKSPSSSPMTETNVKNTTKLLNEYNFLKKKSKDGQTLYTCGICSSSFGRFDNLRRHQRTNHFRPKSLLCEYCGYTTSWYHNLKVHVKSAHNIDHETTLCNICGEEMSELVLKKHMATHTETQRAAQTHVKTQESAQSRLKTAQLSWKDRRAGKSKEPVVFKCNFCINATFAIKRKYEVHMLRHYGEEGRLPCMMCDFKVSGYTQGLLRHLRKVHNLSQEESIAIRGDVEPLTLRLGKLMEKYSEKGPPVPNLDYPAVT